MMLLKCCTIRKQIWKTHQWLQDWKRSVFILISKKGNAKECSNYCTTALISHAIKVMLKLFQARLQQYVNRELPDVQAGFRKGRGTRDQIANIHWIIEKPREFQKNIYFWFIDYAKAFDCVYHNKLWKILKQMGTPDPFTCLLRNLYAGQKATVRTRHGTTEYAKAVCQGCILSPHLFILLEEWKKWKWSCSVMSNSLGPHGLWPTRLLRSWDFPGKSTGVGCHFLLQGIFPDPGIKPGSPAFAGRCFTL